MTELPKPRHRMILSSPTTKGLFYRYVDDDQCREDWPAIKAICLGKLKLHIEGNMQILRCNQCKAYAIVMGMEGPILIPSYAPSAPSINRTLSYHNSSKPSLTLVSNTHIEKSE